MEAFESFVALLTEPDTDDGQRAAPEAIKLPVTPQTATRSHVDTQTDGLGVDVVARQNSLVLATAKSFFDSHISSQSITKRFTSVYALINDAVVRHATIEGRCERYGYPINQSELSLCVGKFTSARRIRSRHAACHARTAAGLSAGNLRTARGGVRWYPSTVKPLIACHEPEPSAERPQARVRNARDRVRLPPSSDTSPIEGNVGSHPGQTQKEDAVGRR